MSLNNKWFNRFGMGLFAAVPGDPLCDMRFGTDYPLTMGFKVGYLDVLYLIAPRIESE